MNASAPELCERYLVPAITSVWANDLLDHVGLKRLESVLDIACGTGFVAWLAAPAGHAGHIVGIDLNAAMLAVARAKSASVEWVEGSALDSPFNADSFFVVLHPTRTTILSGPAAGAKANGAGAQAGRPCRV